MRSMALIGIVVFGLAACDVMRTQSTQISRASVLAGDGHRVTFAGKPLTLEGAAIRTGDTLPSTFVTGIDDTFMGHDAAYSVNIPDLKVMNIADTKGKVRIISVIPSLDTPVCEIQTHTLSEKIRAFEDRVTLISISMDLPFSQERFAKTSKIDNVLFLSDYKTSEFGRATGLLLQSNHLLARAVMVVDRENVIRYIQVVPEITSLPDLEEVVRVARSLL